MKTSPGVLVLRIALGGLGGAFTPGAMAQSLPIEAAAPGLIESGTPSFTVLGPEALGMSEAPVDLQQLPDGRLLAVGHRELALGDGVRWQIYRQADSDPLVETINVAVDQDGRIYAGVANGFARIDFGQDGRWRYVLVGKLPSEIATSSSPLIRMTPVGQEWLWSWGSGPVVAWRPGSPARLVGRTDALERIFLLDGRIHLSDGSNGNLYRMEEGFLRLVTPYDWSRVDQTITSLVHMEDGRVLVGTVSSGVHFARGITMQPFVTRGLLAGGHRINDLCATDGGYFAAAVDNVGIVFFDGTGRTVQVLDRSVDHRLSRVNRLLHTPGGVIWALLNEGIARVGFPDRISHIEPLVPTGLAFAQPYRHNGRLWLLADGRAERGIYDEDNRLTRFEIDTPPGFLSAMVELNGSFLACSTAGIYVRESKDKWTLATEGPLSARIDPKPVEPDCWLYAAQDEIGWLRQTNGRFSLERFPVPGQGHVYGGLADAHGVFWIELGTAKVARIDPVLPRPTVEIFGPDEGVPDGWVQIFRIDDEVRINVAEHIFRFDGHSHHFIPDRELLQRMPQLAGAFGRPKHDSGGRLWIANQGRVQAYAEMPATGQPAEPVVETIGEGLKTQHFTPQGDGVVWLHERMRLARYDPAMPAIPAAPLRALITRLQFPNSNRELINNVGRELPPLDASDNAFIVHFLAPDNPIGQPVTFEVKLEGTKGGWISTGITGSAAFNHLDDGIYELRVRPSIGGTAGLEAKLAFTVLAPWYRTIYAYLAYALTALGIILFAARISIFIERRKNLQLERLVSQRTGELHQSNIRLASQVDEIQMLSQAIGQSPVSVLITRPDGLIVFANPRACDLSGFTVTELVGRNSSRLIAGEVAPELLRELMATVGRGEPWHGQLAKCGKDGRTVPVRTTVSPIRSPEGQIRLHLILEEDITESLADQDRQRRLEAQLVQSQKLESIGTLAGGIAHDFNNILTGILGYCELATLTAPADPELQGHLRQIRTSGLRAKDLVSQILTFSRRNITQLAPLDLAVPVAEAIKLIRASTPATIEITSSLESGIINADATQIQQIVLNLCTNAVHAMRHKSGLLSIAVQSVTVYARLAAEVRNLPLGPAMRLTVADNGHGMEAAILERIFDPFFTTKRQGEGTGLGLSIVQGVIASHEGALRVQSTPDIGTTFELYFPLSTKPVSAQVPANPAPRGAMQEIILVDDEPTVAGFATARLRQLGYQVSVFHDPREALGALRAAPACFAAIITDLTMPHLTGLSLIREARAFAPGIPAVIITGYDLADGGTLPDLLPRCRMLRKPFSGEDLARTLHQVMQDSAASI